MNDYPKTSSVPREFCRTFCCAWLGKRKDQEICSRDTGIISIKKGVCLWKLPEIKEKIAECNAKDIPKISIRHLNMIGKSK